jgi:hypothetical protein
LTVCFETSCSTNSAGISLKPTVEITSVVEECRTKDVIYAHNHSHTKSNAQTNNKH